MNENHIEITKENDVYFMETVRDKIIINHGYEGVEVFDSNLKLIKIIDIFKDIVIHSSYVNTKSNEILLFCPENGCFVHINLNNYEVKTILIDHIKENLVLSQVYLWQKDVIIFDLFNMVFVRINLDKMYVETIREEKVMESSPVFYRFCSRISLKNIVGIFTKSCNVIIQDDNNEFFVYNLDGSAEKLNIENTCEITSFICNDKNVGLVYGNYVRIIGNNNEKSIKCEKEDIFLKAAYLENGKLAILSNNKLKTMRNKVLVFNI